MTLTEILGLVSVGLNVLIALVGATWGVSKIRGSLEMKIEDHKADVDARVEVLRDQFAESFNGMRQKIQDVELFGRDNYVKNEVFEQMMQLFNTTMQAAMQKIDERMTRIETKIDRYMGFHFDGRSHG